MKLVRARDARDQTFLKVLVTGASGSGKTTCCSKASNVLILEPAAQALTSIRAANPNAFILQIDTLQDAADAIYSLRHAAPSKMENGEPCLNVKLTQDPSWLSPGKKAEVYGEITIQSVVIDDFEEIQDLERKEIQGKKPTMQIQDWGLLMDRNMNFLRALRSVKCNVFVCVKVSRAQDKEAQVYEFALSGSKFKSMLPGLFNAMCFLYRKDPTDVDSREYVAGFRLPEQYLTKAHPALDAIEDPDPTLWWKKIMDWEGGLNGPAVPNQKDQLPKDHKAKPQMRSRTRTSPKK